MLRMIIVLLMIFCFASQSFAYLLNTSEIIGGQKMVLQLGYASRNFGSRTANNRTATEYKIAYGLNDVWDALFYITPGQYPDVSGQTLQAVGLDLEYGWTKARHGNKAPLDLSLVIGFESSKDLSGTTVVNDRMEYRFAALLGKSVKRLPILAFSTPYAGAKLTYITQTVGSSYTDLELVAGLKYGFNLSWALMVEASEHFILSSGSSYNGLEAGAGLAWSF